MYENAIIHQCSECCICTKIEIKDFDETVFFHSDSERMTTQAREFLALLQKINPGLCSPKQTSCVCIQCLNNVKNHFHEVTGSFLYYEHLNYCLNLNRQLEAVFLSAISNLCHMVLLV